MRCPLLLGVHRGGSDQFRGEKPSNQGTGLITILCITNQMPKAEKTAWVAYIAGPY